MSNQTRNKYICSKVQNEGNRKPKKLPILMEICNFSFNSPKKQKLKGGNKFDIQEVGHY